ncbi:hypothetical protein PFISCL1PPCAC_19292, partial [Pristionchus fissidentatus]
QVKINGFEFIGPVCLNKKVAKTECAKIALEKIGYAAPNVQTPVIYDPASAYSVPEQIVQARVRSAFEAAELSAMPPPSSYLAPIEMTTPVDKFDPAQIQAMQEQRDKKVATEPQPVPPPPPPPPPPKVETAPAAVPKQSTRGGRGKRRGDRERERGGGGGGGG